MSGRIRKVIRSINIRAIDDLADSIFGFGSYFRASLFYNDIDILIVLRPEVADFAAAVQRIRLTMAKAGDSIDEKIDLTILTSSEAALRPLRDWSELVRLYP